MVLSVGLNLSIVAVVVPHLVQQKLPTAFIDSLQLFGRREADVSVHNVIVDLFVPRNHQSSLEVVVDFFGRLGLVLGDPHVVDF